MMKSVIGAAGFQWNNEVDGCYICANSSFFRGTSR